MTDAEFMDFVQRNAQAAVKILRYTPLVVGDPARVIWHSAHPSQDMLINVSDGRVEVGAECIFGNGIMLLTGTHDYTKFMRERADAWPKDGRDIILEEGVWLGPGVIVLGPSHIGRHAVVGAGSLVRGDLEAYSVYAGNPAKKIGDIKCP